MTQATKKKNNGKVYLVGAGPGDPELMTVRGMKLLQQADTIIHDRLIPHEVLTWCRATARRIDVGKYPDHHRINQSEINELLIHHAGRGELVVRLKGGDPFVFGRGQEEREACEAAGISCEIVPGISSCIAAPSAAGVPVTTRGIARTFAVVTGQTAPELERGIDFSALAKMDTVVVLMGRKNLAQLTKELIASGRLGDTPVACIENATLPSQRVVSATLATISQAVDNAGLASPMVSVIGEVASMVRQSNNSRELPAELQSVVSSVGFESLHHA
jgi:uroporphyrin-III C-methyltransferase